MGHLATRCPKEGVQYKLVVCLATGRPRGRVDGCGNWRVVQQNTVLNGQKAEAGHGTSRRAQRYHSWKRRGEEEASLPREASTTAISSLGNKLQADDAESKVREKNGHPEIVQLSRWRPGVSRRKTRVLRPLGSDPSDADCGSQNARQP